MSKPLKYAGVSYEGNGEKIEYFLHASASETYGILLKGASKRIFNIIELPPTVTEKAAAIRYLIEHESFRDNSAVVSFLKGKLTRKLKSGGTDDDKQEGLEKLKIT